MLKVKKKKEWEETIFIKKKICSFGTKILLARKAKQSPKLKCWPKQPRHFIWLTKVGSN